MKTTSLEHAFSKLSEKLAGWLDTAIEMLPNIFLALLVFGVFYLLGKWIARVSERMLKRIADNELMNKLISRFIAIIVMIAGAFFALGLLHLDKTVTSLLAGIGILGLALSFAFQHTASNILSGIIISVRSSLNAGDLIESNGVFGNVVKVGLRTTKVLNVEGQLVELPNRLVLDNFYKEYSKTDYRRIDITGTIHFREDLAHVKTNAEEKMAEFDFIYEEKPPNLVYNKLVKEKVDFTLRVWMKFTNSDYEFVNARSTCLVALSEMFKEQGIDVARDEIVFLDHKK